MTLEASNVEYIPPQISVEYIWHRMATSQFLSVFCLIVNMSKNESHLIWDRSIHRNVVKVPMKHNRPNHYILSENIRKTTRMLWHHSWSVDCRVLIFLHIFYRNTSYTEWSLQNIYVFCFIVNISKSKSHLIWDSSIYRNVVEILRKQNQPNQYIRSENIRENTRLL